MKKKIAYYCSGTASRMIKFYSRFSFDEMPFEFVLYDGESRQTIESLQKISNKVIVLNNGQSGLSRKEFSQKLSDELLLHLVSYQVDYLICFGQSILRGELLVSYKNKIINFHPSLLPAFPGICAIDQALATNVQVLGNTAHIIDEGIDSGPIIMQSLLPRSKFIDYDSVMDLQIPMLKRIGDLINEDKIEDIIQGDHNDIGTKLLIFGDE